MNIKSITVTVTVKGDEDDLEDVVATSRREVEMQAGDDVPAFLVAFFESLEERLEGEVEVPPTQSLADVTVLLAWLATKSLQDLMVVGRMTRAIHETLGVPFRFVPGDD